jgi:integrase
MGLYRRKDSPFWWYVVAGSGVRKSSGVPTTGQSVEHERRLRRQAEGIYADAQAKQAEVKAGLVKPAITFRAFAQWYETHIASHHRSYLRDKSRLTALTVAFGDHQLATIDAPLVHEWMTHRKVGRAPATVNRELDVLKALLHAAVPTYLDRGPLGSVRRFRVPEQEPRILTPDEEARLLDVADDEARALLVLALDTLLRLSSLVQLKWAQVKPAIIVPLNAKVSLDAVPISSRARVALDALPRENVYVFATLHYHGKGGPTAAKNKAIRLFDRLCQQAGLPHGRQAEGLTFHCLRHTGASRALQAGASVRTVMKLGGWKDLRSVLRYTHVSDRDVQQAAESIGSHTRPARDETSPT